MKKKTSQCSGDEVHIMKNTSYGVKAIVGFFCRKANKLFNVIVCVRNTAAQISELPYFKQD